MKLSEQSYLVLLALAEEPRHGYGITERIKEMTDGQMVIKPGTFYTLLDRLITANLVAPDREEIVNGRLRKYYKITEAGGASASAETKRLQQLAAIGNKAIGAFAFVYSGRLATELLTAGRAV